VESFEGRTCPSAPPSRSPHCRRSWRKAWRPARIGTRNRKPWYRRIISTGMPSGAWSDRRKFLTGFVGTWITCYSVASFRARRSPASRQRSPFAPLLGNLLQSVEVALVKIKATDRRQRRSLVGRWARSKTAFALAHASPAWPLGPRDPTGGTQGTDPPSVFLHAHEVGRVCRCRGFLRGGPV
jgi:hypothetical protein